MPSVPVVAQAPITSAVTIARSERSIFIGVGFFRRSVLLGLTRWPYWGGVHDRSQARKAHGCNVEPFTARLFAVAGGVGGVAVVFSDGLAPTSATLPSEVATSSDPTVKLREPSSDQQFLVFDFGAAARWGRTAGPAAYVRKFLRRAQRSRPTQQATIDSLISKGRWYQISRRCCSKSSGGGERGTAASIFLDL